jgi:hypothetical protein
MGTEGAMETEGAMGTEGAMETEQARGMQGREQQGGSSAIHHTTGHVGVMGTLTGISCCSRLCGESVGEAGCWQQSAAICADGPQHTTCNMC